MIDIHNLPSERRMTTDVDTLSDIKFEVVLDSIIAHVPAASKNNCLQALGVLSAGKSSFQRLR